MTTANSTHPIPPGYFHDPQAFPSPSNNNVGVYGPPGSSQGSEGYRGSPTGSNISLPSLSLPPIRTMDGGPSSQPQQAQSATPPPQNTYMPVNSSLPLPIGQYYTPAQTLPPPQHMQMTSDPMQAVRYPLPPPGDSRLMSGGKHKKEIKRRTKTGCLTCRKRRIKCDEAHPVCRNCTKSKRDCAGYDPIFKSQPGPTAIQPAPASATSTQADPPSHSVLPQGYAPTNHHIQHTMSVEPSSRPVSTEPYDFGAPIDPTLEAALKSANNAAIDIAASRPDLLPDRARQPLHPSLENTKMEHYLLANGIPPPQVPSIPLSKERIDDIMTVYDEVYAPAIDKFLETSWFTLNSRPYLLSDTRLLELFSALVDHYNLPPPTTSQYYPTFAATQSLEAHLVWALMSLCRAASQSHQPFTANGTPYDDNDQQALTPKPELAETLKLAISRVQILESLVTNEYLETPLPPSPKTMPKDDIRGTPDQSNGVRPSPTPALPSQLIFNSQSFWHSLNRILTIHDDDTSTNKALDDTLATSRKYLEMKENRDVLYSVAVARVFGKRLSTWWPNMLDQIPQNTETQAQGIEAPAQALRTAKGFMETEMVKGTNQVVQRVAGWVVRSWTLQAISR